MFRRVRFIGSVSLLYLLTIGIIGYGLQPSQLFFVPVHAGEKKQQRPNVPAKPRFVLVSGKPVRITVPDYQIDLPVDEGFYNSADGSWTLTDTHAQFAMISTVANNLAGNTFIYGHGTDAVFGKLGSLTPLPGTIARVYTDTNQVFTYRFKEAHSLTPNDTSVFNDIAKGQPRLTIQTCTGSLSEWRTMFTFTFERVGRS